MLDVVPPTPSRPPAGPRNISQQGMVRRAPARLTTPRQKKSTSASSDVVKIEWRLPARLRRPVKEELIRQRRKERRRQAIIQFERRPIYSELPSQYPSYKGEQSKKELRGVEQHTGDIYRQGKPDLQLPIPPYRSTLLAAGRARLPAPTRASQAVPATGKRSMPRPRSSARAPRSSAGTLGQEMRDVPYQWETDVLQKKIPAELQLVPSTVPVTAVHAPRRRFALPLHFSIFPRSFLPRRRTTRVPVKKKIILPRLV